MRFCEECGAQLEDDAKFCDECGTPVAELEEEQVTETIETQEEAEVESIGQNAVEEERDYNVQHERVAESPKEKQPKAVKTPGQKTTGGPKKKVILIAVILGVLLVVGIIIGIVLLGKGDEEKGGKKDPVKQEDVNADDSASEDEKQEAGITEAVVNDKKEDSQNMEDAYPLLDEFITLVCSYSDPPSLEGDAWDEYFKGLYDGWASGEDFTDIVVGEDGHLKLVKESEVMFENATYAAYTVVSSVGNMEYGFRVTKENSYHSAELVIVNDYGRYMSMLDFSQEGILIGEENVASGIINEVTGEWVTIKFIPYNDGTCWFYFEDFYDNTSSVIVNEVLSRDCISWGSFDSYQEYYNFLWN